MATHMSLRTKRRLYCATALAAVIVLGIVSRAVPLGWPLYDKSLGDVLYATAAYLGLALLFPRWPVWFLAALAGGSCLAVEFLQLSEVNEKLLMIPALRWFLGTTFAWHDIVCYLLGVMVAVAVDLFALRLAV
jgi:Protein of unknown function (DUF2809)